MIEIRRLDASEAHAQLAADVERGRRVLLAAFSNGALVGTVQVVLAVPPNQPHRGEIAKLLACDTTVFWKAL